METQHCIFCKIAKGEIPATVVGRGDTWIAFQDINPQAPTHFLIIPLRHIERLRDTQPQDRELLGDLLLVAARIAQEKGLDQEGYRVVINDGPYAGQSVYHLHLHILAGRPLAWPPG